ncbi:MAG: c-type cytochrome [Candidatus Thiodiazotropha sp.]|jgi:cytochrome subunit of sulfide dehydrogenase
MKMITKLSCTALLALTLPSGVLLADVQSLADKCDKCHGADGNSDDGKVPNIAGMSAIYISDTLNAYLSGDRKGVKYKPKEGDESDMEEVASKLSEDDIEAISEHYAGKTFQVHAQDVDAAKAAKGRKLFDKSCSKCHSEGGSVADDDAGILLGQWKPYIKEQFELFADGSRIMGKKMRKKFNKLSDEDKANILEFLASGKN